MNTCRSDVCQQGRGNCPTPMLCSGYGAEETESAIRSMNLHRPRREEEDEPLSTPEEAEGWGLTFAWAVLAVLVIACVVGPLYFGVMP